MEFLLGKIVSMKFIRVKNPDEEEFNCDIIFEHLLDFSINIHKFNAKSCFKINEFRSSVAHDLSGRWDIT